MATLQDLLRNQVSAEPLAHLVSMVDNQAAISALITEAALLTTAPNTLTSGAVSVAIRTTFLSVTNTVAYTLADGTFEGQRKTLRCTVAADTPAGTLTPATASGFTTILFDAVNECVELEWHAGGWRIVKISGATPA